MATYTYKGAKITGTSTTAKKFPKSGISNAKRNQTYFNTGTGHVYTCDTAGKPSDAKWVYTRTDIAHPPSLAVNLKAPTRTTSGSNTRILSAKWKVPSAMTNEKKGDRATGLVVDWMLGAGKNFPYAVSKTVSVSKTESTVNLNSFKVGGKTYTRESFYPYAGKPKLTNVVVRVMSENSKGIGQSTVQYMQFTKPVAPTIGGWAFNSSTGVVSVTITTNAGTGAAERFDTRYTMTVTDTHAGAKTIPYDTSGEGTSITLTYNASDYQELEPNEYICISVEAYARGYAGDSAHTRSTFYVSYPNKATVDPTILVSSKDNGGKVTVKINTNNSTQHPVDQVRLGYLANVNYANAEDIPDGAQWGWTDYVDDKYCTALAMPVTDELIPDPGKHTWVCVKSYHASEATLYVLSDYVEIKDLFVPASTATDDSIVIVDAYAGADGESAVVQLAWDPDGTDDATGTELTWSDEMNTWRSTKEPDLHEFDWEDTNASGQPIPITYEGTTYRHSATITIKGLNEGTKYYVRARRYFDDDVTTYSSYSNTADVITSEIPETIVASCERYVPAGSSLQVYWTFAGNGVQRAWQIVDDNGTVLLEDEGSAGSAQIPAERLSAFAVNNSITFTVQASAGSGFISSEEHTVTILDRPVLTLTATSPLTVQPLSFGATVSRLCDLMVIITSQGASGQRPQGIARQTKGDTIYSGIVSPEWTAGTNDFSATVTVPGGLDFWDGGTYTLSVTAIDRDSLLRSEPQTADITIEWAHQAADPFEYVTLTPLDYMDDDNDMHHQAVQIDLAPPATASETDLYDIYRMTGDGAKLIGESFPLTCTTVDEYAPFGDDLTCYYRIALRTTDGDVAFSDVEYNLDGSTMRFDWEGGTLELPYNLSIADSYEKDVDIRQHMDGSMDGYWNQNIERKGSLKSDAIRLEQQSEIMAARQLARYPNAVFVRTPDGSAYEADVQVSDLSTEGVVTAIAIDAIEVGLTAEFILPSPYELEEEETEQEG